MNTMNIIDREDIGRLCMLAGKAERMVITAHIRPDGDAMGSCTALMRFLRESGKEAYIIFPDRYPDNLAFLADSTERDFILSAEDEPARAAGLVASCGLIFCLDFNKFEDSRCGALRKPLAEAACDKVLIDHHLFPDRDLFSLVFSETEISSTAELLFWILMALPQTGGDPKKLSPGVAASLMAGMTTDTNNFANSVFPSTLRMASMLLEAGVDRDALLGHLYNEYPERRLRLLGKLLYSEMKITEDGVAYMILDRKTMTEYGLREGETEGFVNEPLSIGKVRMSIFIKEDNGYFRVSIRSKKGVSANRCAKKYFNGGGHELASGGRLYAPADIKDISEAAGYVERVTHAFMTEEYGPYGK